MRVQLARQAPDALERCIAPVMETSFQGVDALRDDVCEGLRCPKHTVVVGVMLQRQEDQAVTLSVRLSVADCCLAASEGSALATECVKRVRKHQRCGRISLYRSSVAYAGNPHHTRSHGAPPARAAARAISTWLQGFEVVVLRLPARQQLVGGRRLGRNA
jgi:hypothetical protein